MQCQSMIEGLVAEGNYLWQAFQAGNDVGHNQQQQHSVEAWRPRSVLHAVDGAALKHGLGD